MKTILAPTGFPRNANTTLLYAADLAERQSAGLIGKLARPCRQACENYCGSQKWKSSRGDCETGQGDAGGHEVMGNKQMIFRTGIPLRIDKAFDRQAL